MLVDNKSNSKMQKVDTEPYLSTNSLSNQSDALTEIRIKNPKQLIIAHLNINSLRNKFDQLKIWYRIKWTSKWLLRANFMIRFLILSFIYQDIKYLFVKIGIS